MDLEKNAKIEKNLNNEAYHVILKLFTPALTQPWHLRVSIAVGNWGGSLALSSSRDDLLAWAALWESDKETNQSILKYWRNWALGKHDTIEWL